MENCQKLWLTVRLILDPALSTLAGDFIERPTLCVTTRREDLTGLLNCSWSSCREVKILFFSVNSFTLSWIFESQGCTSDVFKCVHLYVQFIELIDENANFTYPFNATKQELANVSQGRMKFCRFYWMNNFSFKFANFTDFVTTTTESVLQVNIKGCGCKSKVN